jgi:hypothetical protein
MGGSGGEGELTPTMKLRRHTIAVEHGAEIEEPRS